MKIAVCGRDREKMVMDGRSHASAANTLTGPINCILCLWDFFKKFFYIYAGACFIFSRMIAHLPVWFGRCSNEPGFIFCLLIGQLLFVSW